MVVNQAVDVRDDLMLWNTEAQLCIQVHVVIPGQPVSGVQPTAEQTHHLREARHEFSTESSLMAGLKRQFSEDYLLST